ncbi:MAG: RNA polymerase sigma factor RpoD/SigA [Erysipelotrichaceae bacterium]|nr:RNA polymerase sigma factor RpoD/SigA [Erysipelotrichaceae bacterium]
MDELKKQLLKLKKEKGYIDYGDMDEIIRPLALSDDQINELIVWICQNDFNMTTTEPINYPSPYFTEISIYPLLTREEEQQLAEKIKQGDPLARDRFIKANLRLVVQLAKQYSCEYLTQYDLFQEGNIGLLKAVDRYDPQMNVPFASYSVYWIRKAIMEAINKAQLIRIPQRIYEQLARINSVTEEYQKRFNSTPNNAYVAEKLGISERRVEELLSYQINISSLDESIGEKEELGSLVGPDDPFAQERVYALLNSLPQRDRSIMEMYYGLNGSQQLNMQQIAEKLSLSKQRVGQIIRSCLEYIKTNYDK